jgi:soluble lytic murein transglycosylase-like protein
MAKISLALCSAGALVALTAAASLAGDGDSPPPVPPLAPAPPAASSTGIAAGEPNSHRALVRLEAARAGLPPEIADAVTEVESGYHAGTIGAAGEIGLMQVMPATARMLGFTGSDSELAAPNVNIHYGVTYLAKAWRLAGGDICTATMKYRAGHGESRFSYRSVDYCVRVRTKLASRGYPVTGTVPIATFGEMGWPTGASGKSRRIVGAGRNLDLGSLNNRLRAISELASARAKVIVLR